MPVFRSSSVVRRGLLCFLAVVSLVLPLSAQRTVAGMALPTLPALSVDGGSVPGTQSVTLTMYLTPSAERMTALDAFLAAVRKPGSPQYHQWLTPVTFAQSFGATGESVAAVQQWAAQQGLSVAAVSASGTSVTLTATTAQVEAALAPNLHVVQMSGQRYMTNTALPSLPAEIASQVLAIDGLNTVPTTYPAVLRTEAGRSMVNDLLASVDMAVQANTSRLLSIASSTCVEDVDAATAAVTHLLLKQAATQGITALAFSGCNGRGAASFPGGLAEVLSVATAPGVTPAANPTLIEARPAWQNAPGVPQDSFRHEPDLTAGSLADFEGAVLSVLAKEPAAPSGEPARLGNIAETVYSMAPLPNVFVQPDDAAAGTWEAATGLGLTNLPQFVKDYPLGTSAAQISIVPQSNTAGANLYSIAYGADETYKITVTGGQSIPGGTVTVSFSPGSSSYTVALAADGTGTFLLSQLATPPPAGANGTEYQITATYNGDNTYASGAYNTTNIYVNPAPVTIAASAASSSGTLYVGGSYVVAVTLSSGASTPAGSVTITPSTGTAQSLSYPQNGSSTLTANFTATTAGTIAIQVTCTPGVNYVCNVPANTSVVVNKATPGVSAIGASNVSGQTATLSATITGSQGAVAPTGQVTFSVGSTTLCTTASGAITGPVSCTATNFPGTSSSTITASYGGDDNYNYTSGTASYTGVLISTKTTLAAGSSPVVVNANINLVATIAPATTLNNTPPSGTITFYDGTTQIAQQPVANYQTSYTAPVVLATAGTHSLSASYSGDANYGTSTSAPQSVIVAAAPSAALTVTPGNTVSYGSAVTLNAAITAIPNNGASTLTGSIKFNVNGTDAVTQSVVLTNTTAAGATAVFPITQALDVGTYTVNLYCTGTNFDCSNFNTAGFSFTVSKANTTTMLQVMPATFTAGQNIYATAIISPASAATAANGVITGTVTFYDNAASVGTVSVYASNGGFQATSAPFTVGSTSDNIVAVFNGDGNNNSSKSNGAPTGGGGSGGTYTTSTTVSANSLTALSSAVVALTATVVATPASGTTMAGAAGGTVSFYATNNNVQYLLGSASLSPTGTGDSIAVLYTTGLAAGTNMITASFAGTPNFSASATTSGVIVQIADYAVSFTPPVLSLTAGQSGSLIAAVNAVNGFSGQVTLGCTPPSGSGIQCSFETPTITASGFSKLDISTTARAALAVPHGAVEAAAGAAGALLLCVVLPLARRRRLQVLAVVVLAVLGSTLGCTNLVNAADGSGLGSGTAAGTEVLTITTSGTDGTTTVHHSYTVPITVQ